MKKLLSIIAIIICFSSLKVQAKDDQLKAFEDVSYKMIKFGLKYGAYSIGPYIVASACRGIVENPKNKEWLDEHPKTQVGLTTTGVILGLLSVPTLAIAGISLNLGIYGWTACFVVKKVGSELIKLNLHK